ncbi:hypothetical protein QOL99_00110 [Deinococcus sp. MIMF12]|uniref:Uncharacterized protein n=1 Tax=Deinococcus rhizophilus TaxID=3049544 RepID=A0ABT7JC61_9DEIO|nr:hypothetical protein [Deinococcus rhizophilus]MDL2342551.1 hypothetical protein [Deinococcus rhizophilus]
MSAGQKLRNTVGVLTPDGPRKLDRVTSVLVGVSGRQGRQGDPGVTEAERQTLLTAAEATAGQIAAMEAAAALAEQRVGEALAPVPQLLADTAQDRQQNQTIISNLSAVGAVQQVAATRAELDPLLTEGQRGLALSGEIVRKVGASVSRLGWLSNSSIPLAGLSSTDAYGDMQQRVADARATGKPLDGAGSTATLAVPAALDMRRVTLRNVTLQTTGALAGGVLTWDHTNEVQTLTETFIAARGSVSLTLPGHGCSAGDALLIFGSQEHSNARQPLAGGVPYYRTGERRRVLHVADTNTVIVDAGLLFDYSAEFPARVVRRGREVVTGGMERVTLLHDPTDLNKRNGVTFNYAEAPTLLDNVTLRGFRQQAAGLLNSAGAVVGLVAHDGRNPALSGGSYGLSVQDLSDVDILGANISAGWHALTAGGFWPTIYRVQGGSFQGGHYGPAIDAHANAYWASVRGATVTGGLSLNALHSRVSDCDITAGIAGAVSGLSEAPAGATFEVRNSRIHRRTGSAVTPALNFARAWAYDGTSTATPDVRYERLLIENVETVFEGGSATNEHALTINVSLKRLVLRNNTLTRIGNPGGQRSRIYYNRIENIEVDGLVLQGERLVTDRAVPPAGGLPLLEATPKRAVWRVRVENVPGASLLGALHLAAVAAVPWGELTVDLEARDNPALPLLVSNAARLNLRQRSSGNSTAQGAMSSTYQTGAFLLEVGEVCLAPDTEIDETDAGARFALTLNNVGTVYAPEGRLRGRLASVSVTGTPTWADRRSLRQATGAGTAYPTLAGTSTQAPLSVPANGVVAFSITVTGAVAGDIPILSPPADLSADLRYTVRVSAANTVQVRLYNGTAAVISHTGTWTARVIRS